MVLRRADVVDGAIALLDAEGLDGLTTRRLGLALQVRGTALYRHFPNKEALLDAMADRLLAGVGAPLPAGTWEEHLALLAGRMREALLAHRDGARVVAGTYVSGPNTLLLQSAIIGVLEATGATAEQAGWIAFALGYYVLGHTIEEQAQRSLSSSGAWEARQAQIGDRTPPGFQRAALASTFAAAGADRFAFGLRLFLDGVRAELGRG